MQFERRLAEILHSLARILVSSGYGIGGLNRLARRAYFEAAMQLDEEQSQKQSKARIAARTGLTRAEVRLLSDQNERSDGAITRPVSRAQRVSLGWISDPGYCDKKGNPRPLRFAGGKCSFETLVRKYSGDIPARAMFSEMCRLEMVKEEIDGTIALLRVDSIASEATGEKLQAISPWISFLAVDEDLEEQELRANTVQVSLNFESLPQLFAAVRDLQTRASTFVDGIKQMGTKATGRKTHQLHVSLALGTRIPKQSTGQHRKHKRRVDGSSSIPIGR